VYVLFVKLHVKPERLDEYLRATIDGDAKGSVGSEPGCYRFDVIQDISDPTTIYFYEVYRDKEAFDAHSQAPHFLKWQDAVKDWYSAPAEVGYGWSQFPADEGWVKQRV